MEEQKDINTIISEQYDVESEKLKKIEKDFNLSCIKRYLDIIQKIESKNNVISYNVDSIAKHDNFILSVLLITISKIYPTSKWETKREYYDKIHPTIYIEGYNLWLHIYLSDNDLEKHNIFLNQQDNKNLN
jgi:hypothetical protein